MIDDGNPETTSEFPMATNDPLVALEAFKIGMKRDLDICFPVCVYSYDRSSHTVEVMPLVKMGYFNGEWNYIRRQPFKVTIRNIQCGGFTIDYPVYIGDTGWVFSSDRDTLLVKSEGALTNSVLAHDRSIQVVEDDYQQRPNQPTLHSFADGFFLPDNWGKWETSRYKDNYGISIGDALYIGSSIDTEDENEVGGQKGDAYEKKTTSSLVLQKAGGGYLLSSTHTQPDDAKGRCRTSKVSVVGDTVDIAVSDMTEDTPMDASISLGADSGIVIRHDKPKEGLSFLAAVDKEQFTVRMLDLENKHTVSISFADGKLNVHASDAINIFSQKDVNIKGANNAYVSAKDARVVVEENASVAAKTVSASAEETINLAAGQTINLTAPDTINLVTASDLTIMAKEQAAQIGITTLSKDSIIAVRAQGNNSQVNISTDGEGSSINVAADSGEVSVLGEKGITLAGEKITINGDLDVSGGTSFSGGANFSGGATVNGRSLTYNEKSKSWV